MQRQYQAPEFRTRDTREFQQSQVAGADTSVQAPLIVGDDSWRDKMLESLGNHASGVLSKMADIELNNQYLEGQFEYALAVSPDPESGDVQNMFAHHSAIGDDSAMYQTYIDSLEVGREGYFPTTLNNVDRLPAYIGVNQP